MAARRISKSSINWSALAERVPPNQKNNFAIFKTRSDGYLRSVLANPETAPKIDWAQYKRLVKNPAMVDQFQKQYEAVTVPYPADNVTPKVEAEAKEAQAEVADFIRESNNRINQYQKNIEHIKSLLPYDQMTMEDYRDSFPDVALDPLKRPTFWPHTPEEQVGYKSKDAIAAEH